MVDALKDLFRTRDHVADFDRYVTEYGDRSERSRGLHRSQLDVRYGDGPSELLDLFMPPEAQSLRPIHLFVHGGYWRMFGKQDFSFVADTIVAAGGIAAVMDYSLMPEVRMETIVDQARRAALWLTRNGSTYGGDATRFTVSGHSAGAHLCCWLLDQGSPVRPRGALLLSGIYDLKPLQSSFLQPLISLTDNEVERFSPLKAAYRPGAKVDVLVGSQETEPFHTQANQFVERLTSDGLVSSYTELGDANHMSVVLDLGTPGTALGATLSRMVAA